MHGKNALVKRIRDLEKENEMLKSIIKELEKNDPKPVTQIIHEKKDRVKDKIDRNRKKAQMKKKKQDEPNEEVTEGDTQEEKLRKVREFIGIRV